MDERQKNPYAVALGRQGGKIGGPARATRLTAEQRHGIASKAARVRWGLSEQGTPRETAGNEVLSGDGVDGVSEEGSSRNTITQ